MSPDFSSSPSPSDSATVAQLEDRITELEIKASFSEDLLDTLNAQVTLQQQQIEALVREITQLRRQMPEGGPGGPRSLRDELPPHY